MTTKTKMKKLIIISLLAILPLTLTAQSLSIRHLLRSCDPGREVTRIHLPAILVRMASWFVDDEEGKMVLKNVRSLYLLVSEDKNFSAQSDFPSLVAGKMKEKNFEELMVVTDNGQKVNILMREGHRKLKEMVITVDSDEDVVLYLKGKLDLEEILRSQDLDLSEIKL